MKHQMKKSRAEVYFNDSFIEVKNIYGNTYDEVMAMLRAFYPAATVIDIYEDED